MNENLKKWQSSVRPNDKKKLDKKIKTYLIGHLDCKTNQVGTQAGGDD